MKQTFALTALVVRDYDEAIAFYRDVVGFELAEDTDLGGGKRWVVVRPRGGSGGALLLAQASGPQQAARIGDQTGGRVFLFLNTDDFARDHAAMTAKGVRWVREPKDEPYGTVAVFAQPSGNLWHLTEPKSA